MSLWTDVAGLAFKQEFYDVKGVRTRVIEAGQGEPFIFLHGAGGHAETFMRNMAAHARHMRVMSVDMMGHGYTDAPDIEYTMDTLVEHIANLVDTLGYDKVSIGGVSLGGMVSAWYAIKHPERVKKLSLVTSLLMTRDEAGKNDLKDALSRTKKATGELSREAVRHRLAWLMHEPDKSVTEELVDVRWGIYSQPGRARIIERIASIVLNGIIDDDWATTWSHPDNMRAIQCPTLLTWSRYNPGLTAERAALGMQSIPNARMEILDNSAHWPHWEEADKFNRFHIEFLTGKKQP